MPQTAPALLALAALTLATTHALADTKAHKVDAVNITGSHSVPLQQLQDAIQEKPGDTVTTDEIVADQGALLKVLGKANVAGGIKTSMKTKANGHIEVTFAIDDQGISKPVVNHVLPKLDRQIFVGNKKLDATALEAATGLKPGEQLSDDKVAAAQKAIGEAYKKVKTNITIAGALAQQPDGLVQITWTITEKKVPASQKKDDEGGFQTE